MRKQFLLLLLTAFTLPVFSQTDSSLYASIPKTKIAADAGDPIYVGPEHVGYLPSIAGTAYYAPDAWQQGSVVFQGVPYTGVYLKYDLVKDEVVIKHPNGFSGITLFTPRVQSFTLGNKYFIQLAATGGIKPGFYEECCKGKLSLYAKQVKRLEETVASNSVDKKFSEKQSWYLLKDGRYYEIKNDKALLDLVPERKKELKDWLKAAGIRYKDDAAGTLKKIVDHYNQLSP